MAPTQPDTKMTAYEISVVVTNLEDAVRAFVRWQRQSPSLPSIGEYVRAIVESTLRDCGVEDSER